jgi:uncharacterized protein YodC (DUF2158 family)
VRGIAALLAVASLALAAAGTARADTSVCTATLAEWQVKRALGVRSGVRLTVTSDQSKGTYSCTWAYATKTTGKILLFKSWDLRFSTTGKQARASIAGELCHFKIACGARLRALRTASNGRQVFRELANAFYRGGKARKVVLASGSPAFVAVGAGGLTGGAYAYRNGWLDLFACVDTRSYEVDADCSATALQLSDS